MATYPDDTKEETKTPIKALFYDVKTDFDGYCSDCAIDMPKGVKKKRHRFSKRICCVSCAEKIEAGSSKKPKADNDELRAIRMELKLVNRRFADLLDLVSRVADHFDIDLSNEEDETKQEEEEEESFEPPIKQYPPDATNVPWPPNLVWCSNSNGCCEAHYEDGSVLYLMPNRHADKPKPEVKNKRGPSS